MGWGAVNPCELKKLSDWLSGCLLPVRWKTVSVSFCEFGSDNTKTHHFGEK